VVGWLNTKMFLETGDAARSQGWAPLILDTNGKGKTRRGDYVEPNAPVDPTKQKAHPGGPLRASASIPTTAPSGARCWRFPGGIVHVIPGSNPPETTLGGIL